MRLNLRRGRKGDDTCGKGSWANRGKGEGFGGWAMR